MKNIKWLALSALFLAILVLVFSGRNFLENSSCGCGPPLVDEAGEYDSSGKQALWQNQPVDYQIAEIEPSPEALALSSGAVLGTNTDGRWIEIDLSDQKLFAHNGGSIDYEFLISSGKWAPTPTGEFRIWIKLKYTKMEGGRKDNNTYYYLPNVPYVQYFYQGYGIHGAYWHNNFGQPMSHGCINMAIPDAEKLFYWTSPVLTQGKWTVYPSKDNPGTRVVIHD